jgi:hypothetical protein
MTATRDSSFARITTGVGIDDCAGDAMDACTCAAHAPRVRPLRAPANPVVGILAQGLRSFISGDAHGAMGAHRRRSDQSFVSCLLACNDGGERYHCVTPGFLTWGPLPNRHAHGEVGCRTLLLLHLIPNKDPALTDQ